MSHGDRVTRLRRASASSPPARTRPSRDLRRAAQVLRRAVSISEVKCTRPRRQAVAQLRAQHRGLQGDWTMAAFKDRAIAQVRAQVGSAV